MLTRADRQVLTQPQHPSHLAPSVVQSQLMSSAATINIGSDESEDIHVGNDKGEAINVGNDESEANNRGV
jgi:hypothetical protein